MGCMLKKEILANDMLFTKLGWIYHFNGLPDKDKSVPFWMEKTFNKLYEDTYFSVVSETIFFTNYRDWEDSAFLSEKTFKAILFKHPFILVATPNTLKYLKALGYKTFSPVIDESYDSIEDNTLRMIAIVKEINRLCKLKGPALEDYLNYCREICDYNFKVFTEKKEFSYPHDYEL